METVLDVLLPTRSHRDPDTDPPAKIDLLEWRGDVETCQPFRPDVDAEKYRVMKIFAVSLESLQALSAVRLFLPQDAKLAEHRRSVGKSLKEVLRRFAKEVPTLDPIRDMGVEVEDFEKLLQRERTLVDRLAGHALAQLDEPELRSQVDAYARKAELLEGAKLVRREARKAQSMVMREELRRMRRVLREMGHVDEVGVVLTKGRTACEINTADELVVTELFFDGTLSELTAEQCVALLSCAIFDERQKGGEDPAAGLKGGLLKAFKRLRDVARQVAKTSIACKMDLEEEEFVEKFNPGMIEAVYAWCKGAKFVEVQKLTDTYEGSTIRMMRRLEELVRQLAGAARAIGNQELQAKFEKGSELIKRDIVFCASLYL
uniref:ATP-dependent RNA helicase Ski2/MTR4 C-terminal domain-containing protein n=2 Tax=Corethron hystrix TaxID=216773 RepID=A0A7S1B8P0_9STRA